MRYSFLDRSGAVVASTQSPADDGAWIPAGNTVQGFRVGDWVVGADGPGARPMEFLLRPQSFATDGQMHCVLTESAA